MTKILVVEDEKNFHDIYRMNFDGRVILIPAFTVGQGIELIQMHWDELDGMIVDACVPGRRPTTIPLVKYVRSRKFRGPVIAASSVELYRDELMAAGATHQAAKDQAHNVLLAALGL